MSERDRPGRAPESSSFAPVPVAPGGGRAPFLVAAVVLAVVSGSFVLAQLDRPEQPAQAVVESAAATSSSVAATPLPTATPPQPTATALPAREWFTAPAAPMVDVPILTEDSIRWLRLGTAVHADVSLATPGRDLLMQGRLDGAVCLCWRTSGEAEGLATLESVSLDHDLRERSRTEITQVDGIDPTGRPNGRAQVALEPSPDGRFAFLARAVRSATTWQVSLDVIELGQGRIVDSADLLPGPTTDDRSEVLAVDPLTLRVAPDGRHVLIGTGVERTRPDGRSVAIGSAWIVDIEDGRTIAGVNRVDAIAEPGGERRLETCSWVTFASVDLVVTGCRAGGAGSSPTFQIRRYDLRGHDLGAVDGDPALGDPEQVLIDSANAVAYSWDRHSHILFALDLAAGGWRRSGSFDEDQDAPTDLVRLAERPASSGPPPVWSEGRPATARPLERSLIGSSDGTLLFAIGDGRAPGSSSGISVFDAQTLRLLERWPALASYRWLMGFDQGRFIAALGRPGLTATGGPADWGASITVHDAMTGGAVVRIADVDGPLPIGFPWPNRSADSP